MTIAQTIANLFDNDGQLWENDQGLDLYELCEEAGYSQQNVATFNEATQQHGSFTEVFFFPDNSYLAISGGAWDISDDQGLTGWGCKIV